MTETWRQLAQQYESVFNQVMSLYCVLKAQYVCFLQNPGKLANVVRRAELRNGEVTAEPIDFLIDVELKAKRSDVDPVLWALVLNRPESYVNLPPSMKRDLGMIFLKWDLNIDGHYRALYYRVRNQMIREARRADEERTSEDMDS